MPTTSVDPRADVHGGEALTLNVRQAATALGVSRSTLLELVSRHEVPFVRLTPRNLKFLRPELERWLLARQQGGTRDGER